MYEGKFKDLLVRLQTYKKLHVRPSVRMERLGIPLGGFS
jgi:hypothetical protein